MTQYHFRSYNIMIEYLHMLQTISQISLVDIYLPPCCFQCCLVWFFMIMCTAAHQASLSFTISQSLLIHMSIVSVMPSNHLILIALFFCPQSFPASASFQVSWLFLSGGKSIGASALASVLVMTIQGWFPLGSPCCPRDSQESFDTIVWKALPFR